MGCSVEKNLDISTNGVYASHHVKLMDQHYGGCVLHENPGLFSKFADAFTSCAHDNNGITIFGLMSHDVGREVFAREMNRRPMMFVRPPELSNTSLLLDELIKDKNTLAVEVLTVAVLGRTFTYTPFMFCWMADAMGRMKLLGIKGALQIRKLLQLLAIKLIPRKRDLIPSWLCRPIKSMGRGRMPSFRIIRR